MESGETLEEGAARETYEETGVRLDPRELRLYAVTTLPEISEVYVGFQATAAAHAGLVCGSECIEVRFFSEVDVPWSELSYPDVGFYLRLYFCERRSGGHAIHFNCLGAASVVGKTYRIADVEETRRPRATPTTKSD
jgi:ADP-ribose pyrophosphatase YjhB (NUDIX family)